MKAVRKINNPKVKLLIFGSIVDELKGEFDLLCNDNIKYAGWAKEADAYAYFSAADLVCFPGMHSVYWEQAVGLGKPIIAKEWNGTTHVDLGGNAIFLHDDSIEEIETALEKVINNENLLKNMKAVSETKGKKFFSYMDIAQRCIE
jgi:glycosyltransferase involved in cell wall biosynthesis